jgi:hypothetical protein
MIFIRKAAAEHHEKLMNELRSRVEKQAIKLKVAEELAKSTIPCQCFKVLVMLIKPNEMERRPPKVANQSERMLFKNRF